MLYFLLIHLDTKGLIRVSVRIIGQRKQWQRHADCLPLRQNIDRQRVQCKTPPGPYGRAGGNPGRAERDIHHA